ncbi:MAG TPA: ABC transporter permease [Dongiaceae bacterium]|nr:ABC transporter permease [Dongiaceae bacterium]
MNVRQDVSHGVRLWARSPGFTIVVVLTLALGIGANTAMFSILHEALLKPLPFKDPARLVLGSTTFDGEINPFTSFPDYYDLRDQNSSLESLAATGLGSAKVIVMGGQRPEFAASLHVSANFFSTLGVAPVAGRWFSPEEGKTGAPYVVLVGESFARRRFGNAQQAVGRQVVLSGIAQTTVSATILGVMPASFRVIDEADMWDPIRRGEQDGPETRKWHNWLMIGRMQPGVTLDRAQADADLIAERLRRQYPDTNRGQGFLLEPLQAGLLREQTPSLVILMVAVGLVLLIACANVAGLLLARGALRRPEIAIRSALGASRGRIVGQLLTESLMLALLSGTVGIALAFSLQKLLPIATGLTGLGIAPRAIAWPVLLFAVVVSFLTGLLSGVAPALRASSIHLACQLAHGPRSTQTKQGLRLRGGLVVSQVAVSLVLLVSAGLLVRSFARLASTNPGFDAQHLLTGEVQLPNSSYPPERRFQLFDTLRRDFSAIPGVTAVGFIDRLPIRQRYGNMPVWATGGPPADFSEGPSANIRLVLPGYFDALRIPIFAGRDVGDGDRHGRARVMVINERMAKRLFPGQSAVGQHVTAVLGLFTPGEPQVTCEVVGVVGDVRTDTISEPARMTVYLPYDQFSSPPIMGFAVRTGLAREAIISSIKKAVAARDADLPLGPLLSMNQLIGDSLVSQRVTAITLAMFAAIAMLLAALGLYGTLAYWVNQRLQEIGIRVALGAQRRDILQLVLGHGMRLGMFGAAIGLVASLALTRLMQQMIYGVGPYDPLTFAAVILGLMIVVAAACYLPARRAVCVDPMTTLRSE